MKRYFEFDDATSYKFWQVAVEQSTMTVTYGKIGTTGQEKSTTFDSAEKALKEMEKLIAEKTKKGYVEKQEARGKKITKLVSVSYEEAEEGKTLLQKIEALLASPQAAELESLVIGAWEEPYENSPNQALALLAKQSTQLPNLRELFVGKMDSEECEISWINQGDYTELLASFPALERLHIKGSTGLVLSAKALAHPGLKSLTIECGGLPSAIIALIAKAELPALEQLCLYLGVDDYGFDGSVETIKPLLAKGRFPKLRHLGLVDSAIADEIAQAVANAPVLEQLESLDLSLGTLSDQGAEALLASAPIARLKRLDLHYHYLSNAMMAKLKALPLIVDVSDQQKPDDDDDWRYPAVTE